MKMSEILIKPIKECAMSGATASASVATVPGVGAGPKVGSLFGGSYKQKKTKKK